MDVQDFHDLVYFKKTVYENNDPVEDIYGHDEPCKIKDILDIFYDYNDVGGNLERFTRTSAVINLILYYPADDKFVFELEKNANIIDLPKIGYKITINNDVNRRMGQYFANIYTILGRQSGKIATFLDTYYVASYLPSENYQTDGINTNHYIILKANPDVRFSPQLHLTSNKSYVDDELLEKRTINNEYIALTRAEILSYKKYEGGDISIKISEERIERDKILDLKAGLEIDYTDHYTIHPYGVIESDSNQYYIDIYTHNSIEILRDLLQPHPTIPIKVSNEKCI